MTSHIIDSIGKHGVVSTPFYLRRTRPRPGDPVRIAQYTAYPYLEREWAYISSIEGPSTLKDCESSHASEHEVVLCIGSCSMFLNENGSVSISGGPFCRVGLDELISTCDLKLVRFWNWGDNSPGASQGIDYMLHRPVFNLMLKDAKISETACPVCNGLGVIHSDYGSGRCYRCKKEIENES